MKIFIQDEKGTMMLKTEAPFDVIVRLLNSEGYSVEKTSAEECCAIKIENCTKCSGMGVVVVDGEPVTCDHKVKECRCGKSKTGACDGSHNKK